MQDGQPIAYASRALLDAERRYAQIEKELLAVTFGLERFHQYTYGRQSDRSNRPQTSRGDSEEEHAPSPKETTTPDSPTAKL